MTTVTMVYLGCLIFGLLFALITGLFGGLFGTDFGGAVGDMGDIDVDVDPNVDVTTDAVGFSPLSPVVICFFIGAFGAMGLICTEMLHLDWRVASGISAISALALASGFFWVLSVMMVKVQGSMGLSARAILGGSAEVSVTIPKGGLGEITYIANEIRQRASAKSEDGKPIPQSTVVQVLRYSGSFYIVRPEG